MNLLSLALAFLALAAWASTGLLIRAAMTRPRIGALTERAAIAVLLAAFGSVCVVLVWNTDTGSALLPVEFARVIFRVCLLLLLLVPTYWLLLYATKRLGDGTPGMYIDAPTLRRAMRAHGYTVRPEDAEAVAAEYQTLRRRS